MSQTNQHRHQLPGRVVGLGWLVVMLITLSIALTVLIPPVWLPPSLQQLRYSWLGEPDFVELPANQPRELNLPELPCDPIIAARGEAREIEGLQIMRSPSCNPDHPADVAAFVKGTNNISAATLMETLLTVDAVDKRDDLDGDGDPDRIHIRLEVVELNGKSPEMSQTVPRFEIAPGIAPGFWVFAPKTRGMSTTNFGSLEANRLLRMPSPVIRVEAGDEISITLENTHYLPHTIHLHGVDHPFRDASGEGNDGVPGVSERMVFPGEARTYEFKARQTGTMFYHCHVQPQVHVMMGLNGMLVVEENRPDNWLQTLNVGAGHVRYPSVASREAYDREYDLHYFDVDKDLNDLIKEYNDPRLIAKATNRGYNATQRTAEYYLLNGRSFPFTLLESAVVVDTGEHIKLRVLNGGLEPVSLHTHGHKVRITHYDGVEQNPLAQITRDVVFLSSAQRLDLLLDTKNDGLHSYGSGIWLLHDHREQAVTTDGINPGGDIGVIVYEDYLAANGWPRFFGDMRLYFSPDYYAGRIPVWSASDPEGRFGEPENQPVTTVRLALLGLVGFLLFGTLVILSRRLVRSVKAR
ncbi:MAG: multicopper oxidase domain-containing protein [Gammaproteobacteria bacterium]|nr:multicopper oxidase domain-containing protein [Gammaproteobacteria bacterium]